MLVKIVNDESFISKRWLDFLLIMTVIPKIEIWEHSLSVVKLIWLSKEISIVSLETGSWWYLGSPRHLESEIK